MTDAGDPSETSAFLAANARLLVAQSRARIDAWKLLKKHAAERCRNSTVLLQKVRPVRVPNDKRDPGSAARGAR